MKVLTETQGHGGWVVFVTILCVSFVLGNLRGVEIISNGNCTFSVYVASGASEKEESAAGDLGRVLGEMSGGEVGVRREVPGSQDKQGGIWVGKTQRAYQFGYGADNGVFVEGDNIFLVGGTPGEVVLSVYYFLQKFCGVKWYMPTDLGEVIPKYDSLNITPGEYVLEPDYVSRAMSGAERKWQERNLMLSCFDFHHNWNNIIEHEAFDDHPEWFPEINGVLERPKAHYWQPNFLSKSLIEYTAEYAVNHFNANPERISFSLGINDSFYFDDSRETREWLGGVRYFRERPDYSDLVFYFMNQVGERVASVHPNKYLGCLAYYWCENVPSFAVSSNVIPYLTADRMQWYDPQFEEEDKALIKRWCDVGPEVVGIYDYYYGQPYLVPRIFTRKIAESIRYAHKMGVRAHYTELYANWALDGPKAWLFSQLLWNVEQDVDVLLNQYYGDLYGESKIPMRQFFENCEQVWMEQPGRGRWLKYFRDEMQGNLFPPEVCVQLREHLDEAHALAQEPRVSERIQCVSEGFRFTELFSDLHAARMRLLQNNVKSEMDVKRALEDLNLFYQHACDFENYARILPTLSELHPGFENYKGTFQSNPTTGIVSKIMRWIQINGDSSHEESLVEVAIESEHAGFYSSVSAQMCGNRGKNILENASFEELYWHEDVFEEQGGRFQPSGWHLWAERSKRRELSMDRLWARSGYEGLRIAGVINSKVYRWVPVEPERVYAFSVWLRGRVSEANSVYLLVGWENEEGDVPESLKTSYRLAPGVYDDWTLVELVLRVPLDIKRAYVGLKCKYQELGDYIVLDDFGVASYRENGLSMQARRHGD